MTYLKPAQPAEPSPASIECHSAPWTESSSGLSASAVTLRRTSIRPFHRDRDTNEARQVRQTDRQTAPNIADLAGTAHPLPPSHPPRLDTTPQVLCACRNLPVSPMPSPPIRLVASICRHAVSQEWKEERDRSCASISRALGYPASNNTRRLARFPPPGDQHQPPQPGPSPVAPHQPRSGHPGPPAAPSSLPEGQRDGEMNLDLHSPALASFPESSVSASRLPVPPMPPSAWLPSSAPNGWSVRPLFASCLCLPRPSSALRPHRINSLCPPLENHPSPAHAAPFQRPFSQGQAPSLCSG